VGEDYFAYGTGAAPGGRPFEVLASTDLVRWDSLGGALEPLPEAAEANYWAPEVAAEGGRFFMYYSVGRTDKEHRVRVAVADAPAGPFRDQGTVLTPRDSFAIDPHPFRDDDGQWYLFYAHDVLEGERVGTTVAVDRMASMTALEGRPRTLLRASGDWQVYERGRAMHHGVYDWHTLEGPFVRRRNSRYYLLYSGGNWQEPTYGVAYAVADHPLGPYREPLSGPTVLQTVPGRVYGPGHNSVVEGPDGEDWIVYHAWDAGHTARRLCIDRLRWGPDGPERSGPSFEPQPAP
jgi:beta-xylosidase